ncbi:MAG: hypothetical protein ACE5MK_08235 [Acidobacteriota bacterium]
MAWPLCSRLAEHAPFRQGQEGHLERTVGASQVEWDGDKQDEAGDEGPLGALPPEILG